MALPTTESCKLENNLSVPMKDHNLLHLYHEMMGHQNKQHVKAVIKRELCLDLTLDGELCEGCIKEKAPSLKIGRRKRAEKIGQVINTDVCGPFIPWRSVFSMSWYLRMTFSKFRKVYFIKTKESLSLSKIEGSFSRGNPIRS